MVFSWMSAKNMWRAVETAVDDRRHNTVSKGHPIVSSRFSSPQAKSKIFNASQRDFSPTIFKSDFPPHRPHFWEFSLKFTNIKLWCQNICKLEFEPYSTMVGENFEIAMSEMPTNIVNCQKSDFPPRQKSENSNSSPKPFLPRHFEKWLPPPDITLWKIPISPQNFGEKWHYEGHLWFLF